MYRIVRIAIAALASVGMLASVAACGSGRSSSEKNGTIEVVASVNQWGTVAKTLGGGNVNVTSIINSTNVDAHDYEPTTSDIAKLQKAQVIIVNGAGYDAWAVKAAQSAKVTVVNATGAGDAFVSALVYARFNQFGIAESARFAMAASILALKHQETINPGMSSDNVLLTLKEFGLDK